jgi:hypothetical protein
MSRIRSIHPGLWTDEEFVTLSAFARLLFLGLWNECDDKGTFEWKPLTLKMRVLPADNVDAAALLEEIAAAGCIRQYEIDGKAYGAVRNFGKFQRPKKPNDIHPATAEILQFCAVITEQVADTPEPVRNQFGTGGEKAPQMEDGGGREGGKEKKEGGYAFCGTVIRLKPQDFARWSTSFPDIDLRAALQSRDDWLGGQDEAARSKWFNSTSSWLAKRQQQVKADAKKEQQYVYPVA